MRASRIGLGIVALFSAVLSTASRAGLFWGSLGVNFPRLERPGIDAGSVSRIP